MESYPVHRQRFPERHSRTCLASGAGLSARSSVAVISIPGVQKPHWSPWLSQNDSWSGFNLVAARQPLDGGDRGAVHLHRQHEACPRGAAVDDDRAGPADAVLAAEVGAGEPARVADEVRQRGSRLALGGVDVTVDGHRNSLRVTHALAPLRSTAAPSARFTSSWAMSRRYDAGA